MLQASRSTNEDMPSSLWRFSQILHGHFSPGLGGILEVCGEAGTGKTQFCLQGVACTLAWALANSSSTKSGSPCALYLYSEDIPVMRLREIAGMQARAAGARDSCISGDVILDSIFLERVDTPGELYAMLCSRFPMYVQHAPIQMIVIDSITTLFRNEELDMASRTSQLFSLACLLKRMACDYNVQVLVTNHVTADLEADSASNLDCAKPALGHVWSSCVSHRIFLYRTDRAQMRQDTGRSHLLHFPFASSVGEYMTRFARVEFSCSLPEVHARFAIGTAGFQLEDDAKAIPSAHSETQAIATTHGVGQQGIMHGWKAVSIADEDVP